jgi:hypothetical protein
MKKLLPIAALALGLTLPGCAWVKRHTPWHHNTSTQKPAPTVTPMIVTPDDSLVAKVIRVNTTGGFVILNFPDGHVPKLGQHLFLYRGGLKTAEVKVVGPQQDTSIVADILTGSVKEGDVVRDQ